MQDMSDQTPFPPSDLDGFLALCVGRWMSLRSRFLINASEQEWHSSERGEVEVGGGVGFRCRWGALFRGHSR